MKKMIIRAHIEKVFMSEDDDILVFEDEAGGHYVFYCEGECCNDVFLTIVPE